MHDIEAAIEDLPRAVNGDAALVRIGRHCTTEMLLEAGALAFHLAIDRGRLVDVIRGPLRMRAWVFAVRAETDAWLRFWAPVPGPGYNDIFAMASRGHARIEGDVGPLLEHLRYLKAVLALPRGRVGSAAA